MIHARSKIRSERPRSICIMHTCMYIEIHIYTSAFTQRHTHIHTRAQTFREFTHARTKARLFQHCRNAQDINPPMWWLDQKHSLNLTPQKNFQINFWSTIMQSWRMKCFWYLWSVCHMGTKTANTRVNDQYPSRTRQNWATSLDLVCYYLSILIRKQYIFFL